MVRRYYPPASLRYLKARLWNLSRPGFWVTAIFLSAIGLVIKEYWIHPDFLTKGQIKQVATNQPANSLSKEDKAIAADIDNLPVLYNEAAQTSLPPTVITPKENTQANNSKSLLDALNSTGQTSASEAKPNSSADAHSSSAPNLENPFLTQAESLLHVGTSGTNSQLLGANSSTSSTVQPGVITPSSTVQPGVAPSSSVQPGVITPSFTVQPGVASSSVQPGVAPTYPNSSLGSANQTNSQSLAPISPSQPPFNQSINQNQPSLNGLPTTIRQNSFVGQSLPINNLPNQINPQTTGLSGYPINPGSTGTGYPQPAITNPYSTPNSYLRDDQARYVINQLLNRYTNPGSGQVLPSAVPSTPIVPPATNSAPTYMTPYYNQTPSQGVVSPSNPTVTNNYTTPSQVPQYNYSSPSQIPGQYTGGNQVNGYRYP